MCVGSHEPVGQLLRLAGLQGQVQGHAGGCRALPQLGLGQLHQGTHQGGGDCLRIGLALGLYLGLDGEVDHTPFMPSGGVQVAAALGGVGVGGAQVVGAHGGVVHGAFKHGVGLVGGGHVKMDWLVVGRVSVQGFGELSGLMPGLLLCGLGAVGGLEAQHHGNGVSLAVVAFVNARHDAVHALGLEAVFASPFAQRLALTTEAFTDLFRGAHGV